MAVEPRSVRTRILQRINARCDERIDSAENSARLACSTGANIHRPLDVLWRLRAAAGLRLIWSRPGAVVVRATDQRSCGDRGGRIGEAAQYTPTPCPRSPP